MIAVDDVGWLDRSSDRVLRYVIRRLAAEPVGVLAARRPGSVAPLGLDGPPLDARLHRVALGPLDPDAIHTLLTERCGLQLPRRLTRRIHAACGGNPFSAVEIGRTLLGPRGADRRRERAAAARRRPAGHRRAHRGAEPGRATGARRRGGLRRRLPRAADRRAGRRRRRRPGRGRRGGAAAGRRVRGPVRAPADALGRRGQPDRAGAPPDARQAGRPRHRSRRVRRSPGRRDRRSRRVRRRHRGGGGAARLPAGCAGRRGRAGGAGRGPHPAGGR